MLDENVETLKKIVPVKTLKDVQHFLGFANFNRRFIKDYSKNILTMTKCHGVTPCEVVLEPSMDRTPYLAMAVTPEQRSIYGVGAGIFERMWSGQGCRRGGDRRGMGS